MNIPKEYIPSIKWLLRIIELKLAMSEDNLVSVIFEKMDDVAPSMMDQKLLLEFLEKKGVITIEHKLYDATWIDVVHAISQFKTTPDKPIIGYKIKVQTDEFEHLCNNLNIHKSNQKNTIKPGTVSYNEDGDYLLIPDIGKMPLNTKDRGKIRKGICQVMFNRSHNMGMPVSWDIIQEKILDDEFDTVTKKQISDSVRTLNSAFKVAFHTKQQLLKTTNSFITRLL